MTFYKFYKRQIIFASLLLLFVFSQVRAETLNSPSLNGDAAQELLKYDNRAEFNILQFVKFVVFLDANQQPKSVVFQNTNTYAFHSDYLLTCSEFKGKTRAEIDEISVKPGPKRKLLLGTVFFHSFTNELAGIKTSFELVTAELVDAKMVSAVQSLLIKSSADVLKENEIAYSASGVHRIEILTQQPLLNAQGVKVLDLFSRLTWQSYVAGWTVGRILVTNVSDLPNKIQKGEVNNESILVLDQVPREIPPVAGVFTLQPTAPSSHVALLAQMFNIPFAYDKEALAKLQKFDGKRVVIKVNPSQMGRVAEITAANYERLRDVKKEKTLDVKIDFSEAKIVAAKNLADQVVPAYGGKSTRMGLLQRVLGGNAPQYAVAIPVSYFKLYLTTAKTKSGQILADFINGKLQELKTGTKSYAEQSQILADIRETMKQTEIPAEIIAVTRAEIEKYIPSNMERLKLRSSSNVEDGTEFNGAGLYESEGVWFRNPPKGKENDFSKGLNKVWRSLYSDRGYLARAQFGVDETKAAMAVLAQETFKNEKANGVAIYTLPEDGFSYNNYRVIGFPGEDATVTNPTNSDRPEITVMSEAEEGQPWTSSMEQPCSQLPLGQSILRDDEYTSLGRLMQKIVKAWPGGVPSSGLDFEWKLVEENGKNKILIKQVRPLPAKKIESLADGSQYFFLGGEFENLVFGYPEASQAFGQLFCPEKLSFVLPSFSEKEVASTILIPQVNYSYRGQNYQQQNLVAQLQKTNEGSQKKFLYSFNVTSNDGTIHELSFSNNYDISSFLLDQTDGSVGASQAVLNTSTRFYKGSIDTYRCKLSVPFQLALADTNQVAHIHYLLKVTGKSTAKKSGEIEIWGSYQPTSGFDKTFHYLVERSVVRGFGLKKDLEVTTPRVAVYTGAHHNFGWGYALDMRSAGLSDSKSFEKTYGRYFLFEGDDMNNNNKAAWLKDDGSKVTNLKVEVLVLK